MGKSMIEERASTDAQGKPYILKIDNTPVRVRYENGVESVQKRYIAEEEARRGKVKILGEARPAAAPKREESESAVEAREKRKAQIEGFKKELEAEEKKPEPNLNKVRAIKAQIEKLEK